MPIGIESHVVIHKVQSFSYCVLVLDTNQSISQFHFSALHHLQFLKTWVVWSQRDPTREELGQCAIY